MEYQSIRRVNRTPFDITDRRRLTFYAVVWDSPADVVDLGPDRVTRIRYRERIRPGAFDSALKSSPDVVADIDHDQARTFARTGDGTLYVQPDPYGLFCSAWVPETPLGDNIMRGVKDGTLSGCSYHGLYLPTMQTWRTGGDLPECDVLDHYRLVDVCLTGNPAYDATDVVLRTGSTHLAKGHAEVFRFRKLKWKS